MSQPASLQRSARFAFVGVALSAASWGTWCVFLRSAEAGQRLSPALELFVVLTTIALVLLPLALRQTMQQRTSRGFGAWALLVVFGLTDALNGGLYFAAIQSSSVAVAALTHYLAPLLVALSAPICLGEARKPGTLFAVALGLLGLTTLLAPWETASRPRRRRCYEARCSVVASALFYATSLLLNKRLSRTFGAAELLVYHMPPGGSCCSACSFRTAAGTLRRTRSPGWCSADSDQVR